MAEVLDKGNYWELVMDTTANPVETINEPTKGYKAVIGEDKETGKHVVMNVLYDKSMSTLDDVVKRVEQLRTCSRCQTLDKEKMKIERFRIGPVTEQGRVGDAQPSSVILAAAGMVPDVLATAAPPAVAPAAIKKAGVKDMFANTFFDAFLTRPGKYFFSVLTNDDDLMESVMPKNDAEMGQFMDEMVEFMSGNMEFVRSPEEAREYLSVIRAGRADAADSATGATGKSVYKKRNRKDIPMMVVY